MPLADDVVAQTQPQAGATTRRLRREKRSNELFEVLVNTQEGKIAHETFAVHLRVYDT